MKDMWYLVVSGRRRIKLRGRDEVRNMLTRGSAGQHALSPRLVTLPRAAAFEAPAHSFSQGAATYEMFHTPKSYGNIGIHRDASQNKWHAQYIHKVFGY